MKNSADYKASADLYRRLRTFNVSDYVMVHLRPEWFHSGTLKKLHARGGWPFQILKRINLNAYMVGLSLDFSISCTFNVDDLVSYRGLLIPPSDPFWDEHTQDLLSESPNYIHFFQNYLMQQKI